MSFIVFVSKKKHLIKLKNVAESVENHKSLKNLRVLRKVEKVEKVVPKFLLDATLASFLYHLKT